MVEEQEALVARLQQRLEVGLGLGGRRIVDGLGGAVGTAALLASPVDEPVATLWIGMLAFFDVVFVTISLWTFEPLMTE